MRSSIFKQIVCFLISWLVVAFGQPAWIPLLGLLASVAGFALFWRMLVTLPTKTQRFFTAMGWFILVQLIQLSWMTSIKYVGGVILLVYFFLAFWWGLQFAVLSLFIPKEGTISFIKILFISSLWTLLEWSRLHVFSGFSWNPVGLALTGNIYSLQVVSITGIFGLSFLVIFTNLIFFNLSLFLKNGVSHPVVRKYSSCFALFIALPYLYGGIHIRFHDAGMKKTDESLAIAAVQTGLLPDQKNSMREINNREPLMPWEQWLRILKVLAPLKNQTIDLILLPEGAVSYAANAPIYPFEYVKEAFKDVLNQEGLQFLPPLVFPFAQVVRDEQEHFRWAVTNGYWAQAIANYFEADLIAGFEDYESTALSTKSYQAAHYFQPNKISSERYEKRVLVPVGEYIPFEWSAWFKKMAARYGITASFCPGREAKTFNGKFSMGVSICYEETYGGLMRENKLLGASFLVNLTNDGWYPDSRLARQHLSHARPRAVENGFSLLRSCNTGVTAFIDSLGRTIVEIGADNEHFSEDAEVIYTELPVYHYRTLYAFWGDYFILSVCCLFTVLYLYRK